MQTTNDSAILQKTRELCQTIIAQPEFQSIRQRVDAFVGDEQARSQFDALNEKGEFLNHKQQRGIQLTEAEISDFERDRESLLQNPLVRGFLDAQKDMHKIQEAVMQHVGKTFELGRVPQQDDFESGSCGSGGCGCHH